MKFELNSKLILRKILKYTPFYPVSVGSYIRNLYLLEHIKKLPIKKFKKIFDAGCGDGNYSKWLANKYPFLKINAYDIKVKALWKDKPENLFFKKKDLLNLNERDVYDFCFCIDVLNCIPKNIIALSNIYKSLKKGGYFYLHIPNKNQKRILFKKYFKNYDSLYKKKFLGKLYSLDELKDILTSFGLKIIEIHNTFGFFGKIAWEIDIIIYKNLILKILLMPFLRIFSYFELISKNNENNGISILSKK